jgi:SWI/SNF-related matrix-associated actin-dependent regulator of chromatin subfamily A-like protein 1
MILLPVPEPGKGWMFRCELRENPIAKRAGFFKFDRELNAWTTRRARAALNLAAYADEDLRADILARAESEHDTDNYIFLERDAEGVYRYYSSIQANHCAQANNFRFASEPEAHWWTSDRISAIACYADAVTYPQFRCAADLQEDLRESATRLNEAITESRALSADIEIPHPPGLDYKPFQYAGIRYGLNCFAEGRGVLFGDEMRLGKTIQSIGLNNAMPEIVSVLVVARATLKINWQRELETWLVHPRTIGLTTTKEVPGTDIVIANYEQLGKMVKTDAALKEERLEEEARARGETIEKPKKKRKTKKTRPQLRPGIDKVWDLVIIDEFHRVSNTRANRTQLFLAVKSKYIAALSGTPLPNGRPKEAWPILHRLDPHTFKEYWPYAKRYCDAFEGRWGWEDNGASNLDEWWLKVRSSVMVRRLRAEVRAELPPKQRQIIELPREYDGDGLSLFPQVQTLVDDYYARLAAAKTVESTEAYAELVADLTEPEKVAFEDTADARHKSAIAKLPLAFKHIEDLLLEEPKVIVFAFHVDVIKMTTTYFNTAAVCNFGEMDIFEQQAARDRFNTDPECKVFVCQITSAEGFDVSVANVEVFLEEVWAPYIASQAEDRAVSMEKLDCILVQHLVQEGSIDCTMARITVEKQNLADQALDRGSLVVPEVRVGAEEPVASPVSLPAKQEAIEPPLPVRPAERQGAPTQTPAARTAASLSDEQIALVHLGLRKLAGLCDGALAHDGAGFSSFDAQIGHSLASRGQLTPPQAALGKALIKKYWKTQLGKDFDVLYE